MSKGLVFCFVLFYMIEISNRKVQKVKLKTKHVVTVILENKALVVIKWRT